ncbi:TPA: O-antigen polymerase [Vibrio cholerae]|nr:oligosaccharide repeat unit polymerase [Vibrio cholerae]
MRTIRPLDILNPSAFFIAYYVFYILLVLFLDAFISNGLIRFNVRYETYFISFLFVSVFAFSSYIITPFIFKYQPKKIREIEFDINIRRVMFVSIFLVFFCLIIHFIYFFIIGFIPAFHDSVGLVRISAKKGFGGLLLLATGAGYAGALLLSGIYSHISLIKKIIIITLVVLSSLCIAGTGFRGPAAYLILLFLLSSFFCSAHYVYRNRIPIRLVLFLLFFILFLSVVDYLRYGNDFSIDALQQIIWTLTVNVYNLNNIVDGLIGGKLDYLYGYSFISDALMVFPGQRGEFLGVTLVNQLNLSFEGEGMTVTAPGEAFINFGYIGVFLYALLIGILSEILFKYFISNNKTSSIVILTFVSLSFAKFVVAGIMPTIIFTFLPVLLFLIPSILWCKQ